MRAPRRLLRVVIVGWLVCQTAAVAAPLALCCPSFGIDEPSCCPGVAPGQVCPMHQSREGGRACRMQSACGHADSALLALAATGLLPPASALSSTFHIVESIPPVAPSTLSRAEGPDLPPPRL